MCCLQHQAAEQHAKRRLWAKDLELEVDGTGDFGGGELTMTFLPPGPMMSI